MNLDEEFDKISQAYGQKEYGEMYTLVCIFFDNLEAYLNPSEFVVD